MKGLVSIVIPVYNGENQLRKCVESITYGNYNNLEIILVEDCSKDGSWKICKQLEAEYHSVKVFRNPSNKGVSYTRNIGLQNATGEIVLFVDCDDWVSADYVKRLVEFAYINPDRLVVCGYDFIDYLNGYERKYLFLADKKHVNVPMERLFELREKVLLQQLWNKAFWNEVIKKNNLRFDESMSMGEDFQFVLEYLSAANLKGITIFNQALYYYIRANNVSLMSKFGESEYQSEKDRILKLARLSGLAEDVIDQKLEIALSGYDDNYINQICRSRTLRRSDKLLIIEELKGKKDSKKAYFLIQKQIVKERVATLYLKLKRLKKRVNAKTDHMKNRFIVMRAKKLLRNTNVTIISQNCIGGVFYHDMSMPFMSPTINLYFSSSDFIKLVRRLDYYMSITPIMKWDEKYPIGILDDIVIRFMHYDNCSDALSAWERRKKRINWDNILVISTDMEGFSEEDYGQWEGIEYKKVLFTSNRKYAYEGGSVYFKKYKKFDCVPDLIPKREFYRDDILLNTVNTSSVRS